MTQKIFFNQKCHKDWELNLVNHTIVIIGASSEISGHFIKQLLTTHKKIVLISRKYQPIFNDINQIIIDDYLKNLNQIVNEINKVGDCFIIFFNGALYENRPLKYPTKLEIKNTKRINFTIPFLMTKRFQIECQDVKKFIYISSLAAVVPRTKNYVYGLNKQKLENSVYKLGLNSLLIFRFGKVFTRMSKNHKTPPFSITAEEAANSIIKNMDKTGIIYPKFGLKVISFLLQITPKFLINIFKY